MSPLLDPLPRCPSLRLEDLAVTPTMAIALVTSIAASAPYPRCRTPSDRARGSRWARALVATS